MLVRNITFFPLIFPHLSRVFVISFTETTVPIEQRLSINDLRVELKVAPQTTRPDIDVPEVKHKLTRLIGCQSVI